MKSPESLELFLSKADLPEALKRIAQKVLNDQRISEDDALALYRASDLTFIGALSHWANHKKNEDRVYFNRNFHIEPTNICIYNCKFCSYARKINQEDAWEYTREEILEKAKAYKNSPVTEVHIVGGVHPKRDLHYYGSILREIKNILPDIHIKAFTAVELEYMITKAKLTIPEGVKALKEYGLDSIPGGGAEIFSAEVRARLCDEKASTQMWLNIHENAHKAGLPSNATMLYGHIESYEHRTEHMKLLRELQDRTGGFNTFIPLKYRMQNNELTEIGEVSIIEDLKNYAVARLYLDNFSHLKAYWPGIGKTAAQLALAFGVDDLDGTIDDSTKIYSLAGAEEQNPAMTTRQLVDLIKQAGKTPVERDTLYNILKVY